ncbi:MAG: hypothetical protein V4498_06315 [candidate division FCPU426 bacterium]
MNRALRFYILLPLLMLCQRPFAAEFDAEPSEGLYDAPASKSSASTDKETSVSEVPVALRAGRVPTAFTLPRHSLHGDLDFYGGGGILTKAELGIFPRFFIGAALNVPGLIGSGAVKLVKEDAQLLARLMVFKGNESFPSVAIGWDGPAYSGGEARGLYAVASRGFKTPLGFSYLHAGLNTPVLETFVFDRDMRGFAAATLDINQSTLFFEADEFNHASGPTLATGFRFFMDPISLGLEFRDLAGNRNAAQVSRLLTVAYDGSF